jgi:hypothetical protein
VRRGVLLLAVLVLAGCGNHQPATVPVALTTRDTLFVNAVRANTHTFWYMADAELALRGRGVCDVLALGGTVRDAAKQLPAGVTKRGELDAVYFAGLAAHDYCPQYPTTKPRPYA